MAMGPVQLLVVGFDDPQFNIRNAGGSHLADAWVHPADLIAVGLIAAEEAAAH